MDSLPFAASWVRAIECDGNIVVFGEKLSEGGAEEDDCDDDEDSDKADRENDVVDFVVYYKDDEWQPCDVGRWGSGWASTLRAHGAAG